MPDGGHDQEHPAPGAVAASWAGEPLVACSGPVSKLAFHLPFFEVRPFSLHMSAGAHRVSTTRRPFPDENAYRNAVIRLPQQPGDAEVPVGVVSKGYALVQHKEVLDAATRALKEAGIDVTLLQGELMLTEYGGRMLLRIFLPPDLGYSVGDDDHVELSLLCFNSVDRSSRLRVTLGWYRFVCGNGMLVGAGLCSLRRLHRGSISLEHIKAIVSRGLELAAADRKELERWQSMPVTADQLVEWVDGPVYRMWGVSLAARALHIARTGHDGKLWDRREKGPAHSRQVAAGDAVPGAIVPADNAYAISQVLAWLAKAPRDIQRKEKRIGQIPALMQALLRRVGTKNIVLE